MNIDDVAGAVCEDAFTDEMRQLHDRMSALSEDRYCAGWIVDNEYALWRELQAPYCLACGGPEELRELRRLSQSLGGWIVWVCEPSVTEYRGPAFVPMAAWLPEFERDEAERARVAASREVK